MTVKWVDSMTPQLRRILEKSLDVTEDIADGAEVVFDASQALVPKRSGALAKSGGIDKTRGGRNTVGIEYTSVYSRWVHEHLHFAHPFGGTAKFLEIPLYKEGFAAVKRAGNHFWDRIT